MTDDRLSKQMEFLLEIDKLKNVTRMTHLSNHGRLENDAEHSWHMAVMAYLLREYSNEPIDIGKTMMMCLIHDMVEIEAGDTYAYDEEGKKTQHEREEKAKEKIFSMLPEDQKDEMIQFFDEFENQSSPEARFARAMDNIQPLTLNNSNNGDDWKARSVRASQVRKRQEKTAPGSTKLYDMSMEIVKKNVEKGNLIDD